MHRTLEHSVDVKVASSSSLPLIAPSASAGALSGIARGSRPRCRSHVACQTNVTELAELSTLQASLRAVREELRVVTFELGRQSLHSFIISSLITGSAVRGEIREMNNLVDTKI